MARIRISADGRFERIDGSSNISTVRDDGESLEALREKTLKAREKMIAQLRADSRGPIGIRSDNVAEARAEAATVRVGA